MSTIPCPVTDCSKSVYRGEYYYGHYMKNWRYGTPTPEHAPRWKDVTGQRFGSLVAVKRNNDGTWECECDCGANTTALIGGLHRGSIASCGDRKAHHRSDDICYSSAHDRVRNDRGAVQQHPCVDCQRPAQHWSYNHDDPDEKIAHGLSANGIAYSLKPEHYSPRCVRCHKRFDVDRINGTKLLGV